MTKYAVHYQATASASVVVEAEDESDAADKADEVFVEPSLCAHCSHEIDLGDWQPTEGEDGIEAVES